MGDKSKTLTLEERVSKLEGKVNAILVLMVAQLTMNMAVLIVIVSRL